MNPFKWFARWLLSEELSEAGIQIMTQEAEITRLMAMIRKDGSEAAERIGGLLLSVRMLESTMSTLQRRIDSALQVHDQAKAPNSTVKRMARLLRQP